MFSFSQNFLVLILGLSFTRIVGATEWPSVPLPENSRGEVVSEHMNYNGLEMKASQFHSQEELDAVVSFYTDQWPGQNVVDKTGAKTVIGHASGDHYITVELTTDGAGTKGTIGVTEFPGPGFRPDLGEDFYQPAGTKVMSDIRYLDGTGARTLVLQNELSPYIVQQHYAQHLRAKGWKSTSSERCKPSSTECTARFEKEGGKKMVMTMARGADMMTATVVNIE